MPETSLTRLTTNGDHRATYLSLVEDTVFARASQLVRDSGILSLLWRWREEDRAPGRYEPGGAINDHVILTAWVIAALEDRVPQHKVLAEIVFDRFNADDRRKLDIRDSANSVAGRTAAVRRAIQRILSPIDPFPTPRNRRLTVEEAQRIIEDHDPDLESQRSARLEELTTRLIATSARRTLHKSLGLYIASDVIIIPGTAHAADSQLARADQTRHSEVIDPFAIALPSPNVGARAARHLWGWHAYLAVPYPPLGFTETLPLVVAGATLQRAGQSDADALLSVLDSARRAGMRRLPIRSSPAEAPFGIPGPPRSRSYDNAGQRRAEGIHSRGAEANVLGHIHHRSRGLAHAQLSLAIHLAAMNTWPHTREASGTGTVDPGWFRRSRGGGDRRTSASTGRASGGDEFTR